MKTAILAGMLTVLLFLPARAEDKKHFAPLPDIRSFRQIFEEIPKDKRPGPGQDWSSIGGQAGIEWVQKYIIGRTFNGKLKFRQAAAPAGDIPYIYADFFEDSLGDAADVEPTCACKFDVKFLGKIGKIREGAMVHVKGRIEAIDLHAKTKILIDVVIQDAEIVR